MKAFPRYELYQESGVDWLGEIPADWKIQRLGTVFEERKEKVSDKDFPPLSVTKNGVLPQLESAAKSDDGDNRKGVREGDFVINSRSDRKGSSGIAKQDGSVSLINIVLKPKGINPRYCEHLLKSNGFIEEFYRNGHGIVADLWTTRYWDMKSILIPLPGLPTQDRIANFLDQKTAEIDEAIAKKQRLIELLKEQKAILINQAVTKGLNPDVTMRDSGVEWIGEVPAHWEVIRLKHLFREVTNRTKSGEEELLSLRMYAGLVPHNDVSDKPITDAELIDYKLVVPGQMVMNRMRASIGLFGVAKSTGLVSPDYAVFDVDTNTDAGYYLAIFKTSVMGGVFRLNSKGLGTGSSGFMRLYTDNFGRIKVPLPPKEEQQEICIHIESLNEEFEAAETRVASEIDLLNEMRATLISYAVTGKIKI